MNHLTDEQFEDIIRDKAAAPQHLDDCPDCRARLDEKRALAKTLRHAFTSVRPAPALAERIRARLGEASTTTQTPAIAPRHLINHVHRRLWPVLAAAAAVLIALVPLTLYFTTSSDAAAAHRQLVDIHRRNLAPHDEFYSQADPEKLAEFFRTRLGFTPAIPCTGRGMAIRGCCIAHFRDRIAGSYVVDTPKGIISVIVVTDTPRSLGMTRLRPRPRHGQTFWKASFADNNMITVRLGRYSYCAVGETSQQYLIDLLTKLLPQ